MNSAKLISKVSNSFISKCSELSRTVSCTATKNSRITKQIIASSPEKDVVNFSTKTAKQIFEEFKPVIDIHEAAQRAEQGFGIHIFNIKNIDVANDALYVLHKIKSKSLTPLGITEIKEVKIIDNNPNIWGCIYSQTGAMEIASIGFQKAISSKIGAMAQQVPLNKIHEYQNLLIKMNEGKLPMFQLTEDIEKMGLKMSGLEQLPFQTLVHEQGHRAHYLTLKNKDLYWKMLKAEEMKEMGITDFRVFEEFMSKKIQDTISSWPFLGSYAKTSPCEFVAEVYSALIHGIKAPENIMKLYKKYQGPKILM